MAVNPDRPAGIHFVCEYLRQSHDYRTECGFRATGYNKYWIVCPYCARHIHIINRKYNENEEEDE